MDVILKKPKHNFVSSTSIQETDSTNVDPEETADLRNIDLTGMASSRGTYERLQGLSDIKSVRDLNADAIRDLLRNHTKDYGLQIASITDLQDLSGTNDAFNSSICGLSCVAVFSGRTASLEEEVKEGGTSSGERNFHFVVKCPPSVNFIRFMHKFLKPFCNEVSWYLDLVHQLELVFGKDCMKSKIPECYFATSSHYSKRLAVDSGELPTPCIERRVCAMCWMCCIPCARHEEGVLVLEDVKKRLDKPYRMFPKLVPTPLDHVRLAFERLAEFHGMWLKYRVLNTSGALARDHPDSHVIPWHKFLKRFRVQEKVPKVMYLSLKNIAKEAMLTVLKRQGDSESATTTRKVKRFFDRKVLEVFNKYFSSAPSPECHTLCHGDFWSNNMLFSYGKAGEEVDDLVLLDFQMVNYGHPCYDLVYFLYISTDLKFRDDNLANVLSEYYSKFSSYFDLNLCPELKSYTFERFMEDFNWHRTVGAVTAAAVIPNVLADSSIVFEGNLFTAFRKLARKRKTVLENETSPASIEIRRRLLDLVHELDRDEII